MPKYEVQRNPGGDILVKDGYQAFCPFVPPMVMQSNLAGSQPQMTRIACSTGCALAELVKEPNGDLSFNINCGAMQVSYAVTELEQPKEENKSPLVKV